jgi:hypothetical protein
MEVLFKEMGFKRDSSSSVQRAFFKHLTQAAKGLCQQNVSPICEQKDPMQLCFDPKILKAGNE